MKKTLLESKRLVKAFTLEVKQVDEENHVVEGVFSTAAIDRHGEVVVQEGWKLEDYIKNPVVLWSHDNYQFPLAQMTSIGFEGGNLVGKMKFAVEEYEQAATAFKLMKGKYLRAFSVGFMNNVYEIDNGTDVVKLIENVLLEVSVVNVPANQEALAKIKAIDMLQDPEEEQDGESDEERAKLETDKALNVLVSSKNEQAIRSAIKALTDALNDEAEPDTQVGNQKVEHPERAGTKKIPVKQLNRVIKTLLGVKTGKEIKS